MSYARNILELSLLSVDLDLPIPQNGEQHRLLWINLVAPRPTIAARSHQRTIELIDHRCDLHQAPFHQRIIFKETVQGPFGVEVAVSEREDIQTLREWLGDLADYALRGGATYFNADFPTHLRTVSGRPFRLAGDSINPSQRDPSWMAIAGKSFSGSDPTDVDKWSMPLLSTKTRLFPSPAAGPRRSGRGASRRAPVRSSTGIEKDSVLGSITFSMRIV